MEGKMFPYAMVESSVSPGVCAGPRSASRVVSLELFQFQFVSWTLTTFTHLPRLCPPTPPSPYPHHSFLCLNWNHIWVLGLNSDNEILILFVRAVCLPSWEESVVLDGSVFVELWDDSFRHNFGFSAAPDLTRTDSVLNLQLPILSVGKSWAVH